MPSACDFTEGFVKDKIKYLGRMRIQSLRATYPPTPLLVFDLRLATPLDFNKIS